MKKYLLTAWIVTVPLALVPGCASHETDTHPFFTQGIQEPDIPIPQAFQFDKNNPESFSFIPYSDPKGVGYFRSTEGIYYGNQMIGNLVPWYEEQMQLDGWKMKESRIDSGRNRLTFTKTDETATIWLYRQFDARFDQHLTFIKIKVGPTATESQTPEELIGANPQPTLDSILQAGGPAGAEKGNPAETEDAQKEGDEIIHNLPPGQEKEGVPSPASAETIEEEGAAIEGSNKQVVKERPGTDNIEDSSNGEDVTPDDE